MPSSNTQIISAIIQTPPQACPNDLNAIKTELHLQFQSHRDIQKFEINVIGTGLLLIRANTDPENIQVTAASLEHCIRNCFAGSWIIDTTLDLCSQFLIGIGSASENSKKSEESSWDALRRATQKISFIDNLLITNLGTGSSGFNYDFLYTAINNCNTKKYPRIHFVVQHKTKLINNGKVWQADIDRNNHGGEVLVRLLKDAQSAPISPFCFINDISIDSRLQFAFDQKLFQCVSTALKTDPEINLSINLYPKHLSGSVVDIISEFFPENLRNRLQIEILEGGNLSETGVASLKKLFDKQFNLAIDDFGTSDSNFDRLKHFHPSRDTGKKTLLKVDKEFVNLKSITIEFLPFFVGIAKRLNFDLCFEGINELEGARQLESIAEALNYDKPFQGQVYIQGFHYHRESDLAKL